MVVRFHGSRVIGGRSDFRGIEAYGNEGAQDRLRDRTSGEKHVRGCAL